VGFVRCRVDDRLVHAEVLYGELQMRDFTQLVVASRLPWADAVDPALVSPLLRTALVTPPEVVSCLGGGDTLVVVGTLLELREAVAAGFTPDVVALANRSRHPGARQVSPTFWLDADEEAALTSLLASGLVAGLQRTPSEPFRPLGPQGAFAHLDDGDESPETEKSGSP
jgi:mannose/fructose/N-acetylgalactosamine-specific phosphotransferase system component IIB